MSLTVASATRRMRSRSSGFDSLIGAAEYAIFTRGQTRAHDLPYHLFSGTMPKPSGASLRRTPHDFKEIHEFRSAPPYRRGLPRCDLPVRLRIRRPAPIRGPSCNDG